MSFELRPAVRENVPLMIGLAGGTGSGKTKSAFELAKGMSNGKPFACIDTESGRAKAYADDYKFDSGELIAPFRPDTYTQAIIGIDKLKKYDVIVIDSASHEYAGEGGVLDWQEEELYRMAGDDYGKREACKMASWVKPKMGHKQFMNKLLQVRAHIIMCFRAEPKTEMVKAGGKTVVRPKEGFTGLDGWFPICEKNQPYEMTAYFLLMNDKPGVPMPIKLLGKHKPFFPEGKPITEECGRLMAEWAHGGAPAVPVKETTTAVTREQAAAFTEAFNAALPDKVKPVAKTLLTEWLKKQGLAGLSAIDPMDFDAVRDNAIQYAEQCA